MEIKDYASTDEITWCPGCGNFPLLASLKQALAGLQLAPSQVVICSGIGQAAKLPHYIKVNCFNGLHGRALPPAQAIAALRPDMKVIITSGDGDTYGEGGNHFIHALRRNADIAHFVHDNQIYGLTKGQGSPTTQFCQTTTLQPFGVASMPLNPLALAISQGAGFVARGFVGNQPELVELMQAAIQYPGYALLDILQPCISFNKVNTFAWYKERVRPLPAEHNKNDRLQGMEAAWQFDDAGIYTGVLYQRQGTIPWRQRLNQPCRQGGPALNQALKAGPDLAKILLDDARL